MYENSTVAYSSEELIERARNNAPYYQRLYAGLPETAKLAALPIIDPDAYWAAHRQDRQEVLTETHQDGFVLNSSGTSGPPKFLYCTAGEWDAAVALSARSFDEAGLSDGDRVATLFATGNMYASQMFATLVVRTHPHQSHPVPVGYWVPFADATKIIEEFKVNVLAGFPTHLLRVIDALDSEKSGVRLDHLLYAGEIFTAGQQRSLRERFPGLQIHSAGYASVEGGPIGYADAGCTGTEHRVYDGGTIVEILDEETAESIQDVNRPGRVVFTSLVRRLMPLIRYPTGDLAQWIEPAGTPNRKFALLGRSGQGVRVATYNVALSDVVAWLEPLRDRFGIEHFQLLAAREGSLDHVAFRLVSRASSDVLAEGHATVLRLFAERRPDIQHAVEMGILGQTRLEWIDREELIVSERTGKMLSVVDRRDG